MIRSVKHYHTPEGIERWEVQEIWRWQMKRYGALGYTVQWDSTPSWNPLAWVERFVDWLRPSAVKCDLVWEYALA